MISAPREAATGFPRLCYAYFSFHMTQWDYDDDDYGDDVDDGDGDGDGDDGDAKVGPEDVQVECGGETGGRGGIPH